MASATLARRVVRAGWIAVALGCAAPARGDTGAVAVVETLHAALAENIAATPPRGFDERLRHVEPVVAASFDFDTIARVALGATWDGLDGAARERFRALIERESALTYADRFSPGADSVRFVTVEQQPARRARVLVRTRLERPPDSPVTLDYVVQDTAAGPRIVNVLAEGVSDLSLKRAQFAAVIREDGVDGLLRRLEEQVRGLAARVAAGS